MVNSMKKGFVTKGLKSLGILVGLLLAIFTFDLYTVSSEASNNLYNNDNQVSANQHSLLTKRKTNYDSFVFFTDPHIYCYGHDDASREKFYIELEDVYQSSKFNFIISGGDWIDSKDTEDEAIYKLTQVKKEMNARFDNYHLLVGNHDTNYQGEKQLTNEQISNLWYDGGNAYYTFRTEKTRYYAFDTGIDWKNYMVDYRWEQMHWFAQSLIDNNDENIMLFMHIFTQNKDDNKPSAFAETMGLIAQAFNNKWDIYVEGKCYDFSQTKGKIRCVFAGHSHRDFFTKIYGIPVIGTTKASDYVNVSCDLCFIDYDENKVRLMRYGVGKSRVFDI